MAKTAAATAARQDTARFNHQAVLALADQTTKSREEIAEFLGISARAVRRFLNSPCEAYELERQGVRKRAAWEQINRTKRGRVPFFLQLATEIDVDEDVRAQMVDWRALTTREKVGYYLREGFTGAKMAQLLGISRQAVSKHVAAIRT